MKVADDPEGLLSTETIARRGATLYKAAMKGYEELKAEKPDAMRPVFVIGSEVPIPGGAQEAEDTLAVTKPEAFRDTSCYLQTCLQRRRYRRWHERCGSCCYPARCRIW